MARYKKLLVLVDPSETNDEVIAAARDFASQGAQLVLLHVMEYVPVEPMGESIMPTVEIEDELVLRTRERLAAILPRVAIPGTRARAEVGNPKAEVLRVAEEESADLIVVGGRERHGLNILVNLLEDTLLHAAHCDLLAVRVKPS